MIESPCVDNCEVGQNDRCKACGRHVDDIVNWPYMTDEEKQAVLDNLW